MYCGSLELHEHNFNRNVIYDIYDINDSDSDVNSLIKYLFNLWNQFQSAVLLNLSRA